MRFPIILGVLLLALVLMPRPGEAQFRILPSAGLYMPLSDLNEIRDQEGNTVMDAGRRSSTLALGMGAELGGASSSVGFRVQVLYATNSRVPLISAECPGCELRSTLLTGTGALVVRPLPGAVVVQPYILLGGGVKRYDFDREDFAEEGFDQVFRNQTQPTLHIGAGTTLYLGLISPQIELSAFISGIEGAEGTIFVSEDERQTDLFLTVAFPLGR
jgi:hypothetical protein